MTEQNNLPQGWKWVRLGEVISFIKNGIVADQNFDGKGFQVTRIETISNGVIDPKKVGWVNLPIENFDDFKLCIGDILFSHINSVEKLGNCAIYEGIPENLYHGMNLLRIKTKEGVLNPVFLLYWLRSITCKDYYVVNARRAIGQASLNQKDIKQLPLPLPPLSEQKRIATKIQELMQEVERARLACEKQFEAAKALPAAYLREVFQSEEAKKWERRRLGEVCEIFSGSSAPQGERYFEKGKYPFVRVQDLGRYGKTTDLVDIKDYINDDAIKELKLVKAEKGTILFPKSGAAITTNNRAILGVDAFVVSHLAAIRPKLEIADVYFIYYWLGLTDMVQYMENPGYPSLKLSTVSKIPIPLPPLNIQQRIASELKEKMAQVEKLQSAIEKQLEAINALPQAILRKAFRGEL